MDEDPCLTAPAPARAGLTRAVACRVRPGRAAAAEGGKERARAPRRHGPERVAATTLGARLRRRARERRAAVKTEGGVGLGPARETDAEAQAVKRSRALRRAVGDATGGLESLTPPPAEARVGGLSLRVGATPSLRLPAGAIRGTALARRRRPVTCVGALDRQARKTGRMPRGGTSGVGARLRTRGPAGAARAGETELTGLPAFASRIDGAASGGRRVRQAGLEAMGWTRSRLCLRHAARRRRRRDAAPGDKSAPGCSARRAEAPADG